MRAAALLAAVLVVIAAAAAQDPGSRYALERERAASKLDTAAIARRLRRGGVRARLTAALAAGRGGATAGATAGDVLVTAFSRERDPRVRRALAAAIAGRGVEPVEDLDAARRAEWRHARIVALIEGLVAANTDAAGDFRGFYRGQFAPVAAVPDAVPVLEGLASAPWERDAVRRAAIRALGETGGEEALRALTATRARMLSELGLPDPETGGWRVPFDVIDRYADSRRLETLDHARALCGEDGGLRWRIAHHGMQRRRFVAALVYVPEAEHPAYRSAAASETFEIAYLHARLGETAKARKYYQMVVDEYGETATAATAYYNLACLDSRAGDVDGALANLRRALGAGYVDLDWMKRDADLARVRADPRFAALSK